ncbi:MAG: molybdenum cofactor biosynthesis protein MoaE, partial [Candidatus Methylomirabilales bacterium]
MFEVTDKSLSVNSLMKAISRPTCGAIALFVGVVREP